MTEPEQDRDDDLVEPIQAPPTANPRRVQMPEEGLGEQPGQERPEGSGPPLTEEG